MYKDKIMEACSGRYNCLEEAEQDGLEILTIGKEDEPLVLNFEIGDNAISVNVINKDTHELVDDYTDDFDSEAELGDIFDTAISTYESIKQLRPEVEKDDDGIEQAVADVTDEVKPDISADSIVPEVSETDELSASDLISKLITVVNTEAEKQLDDVTSKLLEDIVLQLMGLEVELKDLIK